MNTLGMIANDARAKMNSEMRDALGDDALGDGCETGSAGGGA